MTRAAIPFLLGGQLHNLADLMKQDDRQDIAINHAGGVFHAPASLASLCKLLITHPESIIVADCVDVVQPCCPPRVVWLGRVKELHDIHHGDDGLYLGAAADLSEARPALAQFYPALEALLHAPATVGGSIVGGTGDVPPALIAADASLHLRFGDKRRVIPLEDFFIEDGQQDRENGELIVGVSIPPPPAGSHCRAYKHGTTPAAFRITLSAGVVTNARLAFGTCRAKEAEEELLGRRWNETHVRKAMAAMEQDGAELLLRFFVEGKEGLLF